MKTIEYLKEHGIKALEDNFHIKVKQYDEGLLVLNYDQIHSPKTHPIVMECRGLILDSKNYNVVSRGFDRFFNYGEQSETLNGLYFSNTKCFEKIDGSLIKIYHWGNEWRISTRGTAFAETTVNRFDITYKELVLKALNWSEKQFQESCEKHFSKKDTHILEVVSPENRVIKRYDGCSLYYLTSRDIKTGEYWNLDFIWEDLGALIPEEYSFKSINECLNHVKTLKNLDEGFVLYHNSTPICKIKSPTYIAMQHIKGEGISLKRVCQVIIAGEHEEYLNYFPDDRFLFEPYIRGFNYLMESMASTYNYLNNTCSTQKELADEFCKLRYSAVLFNAKKKNINVKASWNDCKEKYKIYLLQDYTKALDKRFDIK